MSAAIAIQLYSVRNELDRDFAGTMAKIATFGVAGVEFAGCPWGLSFPQCHKIVKELGLKVPTAHFPIPIGANRNLILDNAEMLGCRYLVTGKSPDDFKSEAAIRRLCDDFNAAAANVAERGMQLAIHNHWGEFQTVDGVPAYKIMLRYLDPQVKFELDTYWIMVGGQNPAAVVAELADRAPLLHIKDGSGIPGNFNMVAVGTGKMDFPPIFARAKKAEWLIVELDSCETDMLTAIRESCEYIGKHQ